jgi:hypothetical protein
MNNSQLRRIRLRELSALDPAGCFLRESSSVCSPRRYPSRHTDDLRINRPSDLTRKGRLNIAGYVLVIAFYIQHRFARQKKLLNVFILTCLDLSVSIRFTFWRINYSRPNGPDHQRDRDVIMA